MKLFQPMQAPSGSRSGGALIVALVTISAVVSLGGAYLQMVTSASKRQSAEVGTLKAFYLAEAGLAEAFQAVRMGRSGQIGSIQNPAQYAKGLVWVDASQTKDDQIRLVATGMWGGGRATIAYVLEPKELTLGIFSEENLDIDQVLMIDGYDSGQGSYTQQVQEEQVQPAGMPLEVESFLSAAC
ncbi:MAG: hypothetical protein JKY61_12060, partial [Planctomycetes bacterium]|nr:hypothetical protein [Planctomycetota bacterium]